MTDSPNRVFYLSGGDLLRADDATLASALIANDVRAPRVAGPASRRWCIAC